MVTCDDDVRWWIGLTTEQRISWLQRHGSSLVLNWGEDGWWEVAWITGGERYCGTNGSLHVALQEAWSKAQEAPR